MRRETIYSYYAFGYNYYVLQHPVEHASIHGRVLDRITEFFEKLRELDLQVTIEVASDLDDLREKFSVLPKDALLSKEQVQELKKAVMKADATLDAELALRHAYIITPKRYDISRLLDRPKEILGNGVFLKLSSHAQRDFALGCQCIAFNQPTAAAFHLLRATEEMVRRLYCMVVPKKERPDTLLWGPMLQTLRSKNSKKVKAELLDHLDTIRRNYRNPTQHPELFYDSDSAQDLLSNCCGALNSITAALPKKPIDDSPF